MLRSGRNIAIYTSDFAKMKNKNNAENHFTQPGIALPKFTLCLNTIYPPSMKQNKTKVVLVYILFFAYILWHKSHNCYKVFTRTLQICDQLFFTIYNGWFHPRLDHLWSIKSSHRMPSPENFKPDGSHFQIWWWDSLLLISSHWAKYWSADHIIASVDNFISLRYA